MSFEYVSWAWRVKVDSPAKKILLVAIADAANGDGRSWRGQLRLAQQTELKERTVRKHLHELEEGGFIRRTPRRRADGSRTSDYIDLPPLDARGDALLWPGKNAVTLDQSTDTDEGDQPAPHAGSDGDDQPAPPAGPTGTSCQTNRHEVPGLPARGAGHEPSVEPPVEPSVQNPSSPRGDARVTETPIEFGPGGNGEPLEGPASEASRRRGDDDVPSESGEVPRGADALTTEQVAEWMRAAWNAHRGTLPACDKLNKRRRDRVKEHVREHGKTAFLDMFELAVRNVAKDPFWRERRYGIDTLLGKSSYGASRVLERFEAERDARAHHQHGSGDRDVETRMRERYPEAFE